MRPTNPTLKHFSDRLIMLLQKSAQRRRPITAKRGNKDFYKGTGSANMGRHTKHGNYIIDYTKVRTYVVPEGLENTNLKAYVPNTLPSVIHHFPGYAYGANSGDWYIDKHAEYLKYGADDPPSARREKPWEENF
ncbi:mitochondrial ribosomal protein L27-domain-containing protein [Lipomyces japonicus]|uniref:mitochondrial 54S ribosomal protein mL41 n=1 Tax=Lipomyces japonicus TaxID=56871 RepID=UPI0034CF5666